MAFLGVVLAALVLSIAACGETASTRLAALASANPSALAPADRDAYFKAVIAPCPDRSTGGDAYDNLCLDSVDKLLWLDRIVAGSDRALSAQIRAWLFERAWAFVRRYQNKGAGTVPLPPAELAAERATEAAWGAWITAHLATLTEDEADTLVRTISPRSDDEVDRFPGVDSFALGLAIADLWVREGHPDIDSDHAHPELGAILGAVGNEHGYLYSHFHRRGYPGNGWYGRALATDADTHRLAQAVLARKDPLLTRRVALGVGRTPKTLAILHEWEADPDVWRDALFVIARVADWRWMQEWLVPELQRVWSAQPSRRGVVLYALAEFAVPLLGTHPGDFEGPTPLKSFAEHFGGRITRAELEAFLDQSPRSLDLAVWLMPARTKDWSVVDVILPRLDAYLALPHDGGSTPGPGLGSLVGALCYTDFDARGWAKLRAYFDRRAASHPGDPLNVIMDLGHYAPARCHAHG